MERILIMLMTVCLVAPIAAQTENERKAESKSVEMEDDLGSEMEQAPTLLQRYKEAQQQVGDNGETEQELLRQLQQSAPNSFEANYATYLSMPSKLEGLPHLEAAYRAAPERSEIYHELIAVYEIAGEPEKKKEFCLALDRSASIPDQVATYSRNALLSVESGGVLITNGYDDTYPAYLEQELRQLRPDVRVVQLGLLREPTYRNRVFKEIGVDHSGSSDPSTLVGEIVHSRLPIYFSLTLPKNIIQAHQDQLYLTGLALRYCAIPVDNASLLKANWEKMDKEHLKGWIPTGDQRVDDITRNYLLPLAVLEDIYASEGDRKKANEVGRTLDRLAGSSGNEQQLRKARAINTY